MSEQAPSSDSRCTNRTTAGFLPPDAPLYSSTRASAPWRRQPGLSWVACGSMDGSVSVLCMETGRTVAACKPHTKYVIRVLWAGDVAVRVLTASHDQSVSLLELDPGRAALEVIKKVRHLPPSCL